MTRRQGARAQLEARIIALEAELKQTRARLAAAEALADLDPLAPVFNRRAFERELQRAASFAARYRVSATLIYIDLDGFKALNDLHGHAAGDAALKAVAALLKASVRESDVVGRLGGDEFGVILAKSDLDSGRLKAQRLVQRISDLPLRHEGRRIALSASAGAYTFDHTDEAHVILERADEAMYAAKALARQSR